MGHLHHPDLNELSVVSDLDFKENQRHPPNSPQGKALSWFLRSGIFMLSGVVIVAGMTIVVFSYIENTTTSSSQASEAAIQELPENPQLEVEPTNSLAIESGDSSPAATDSTDTWQTHSLNSNYEIDYPSSWQSFPEVIKITEMSRAVAETKHSQLTINCANCPDALDNIGKLEVIAALKTCKMSDVQLDVIGENYTLLVDPSLLRSNFSLVTTKDGACGLAFATNSSEASGIENYYYRVHWLVDDQVVVFEAPLAAAIKPSELDDMPELNLAYEPLKSAVLTYHQMFNSLSSRSI